MAARKAPKANVQKATVTEDVSRFRLGELGYAGLKISSGVAQEELKQELNFPNSMITYKQMTYHSVIAAALALYEIMCSKVEWKVVAPEDATEEEKQHAKFIRECMGDMDHSWLEFMQEVVSAKTYGFAIHEKVYRRRLKSKGSKYDDGLIGWKKLAPRSQDTIDKFIYDNEGRELLAVQQNLNLVTDGYLRFSNIPYGKEITIPRTKFMLFRTGKHRGNPFGRSSLRDCYFSWKFLTQIEEIEAAGVARDLQGLPVLHIPATYMTEDASPAQKQIYEYYKNAMRNLQMNQQASMILPSETDPDSREPLFKLELLGTEGKKNFNTESIINYHKNNILTALFADILIMGQSTGGSYALGNLKANLMGVAVEAFLREVQETINEDLIRQTYELNGWDTSRLCKIVYDDFQEENLEEFSKLVQRVASVGLIEKDRAVLNKIRASMGVELYPEDMPVQEDILTGNNSKAGNELGNPNEGSRKTDGGQNDNDNNADNAA